MKDAHAIELGPEIERFIRAVEERWRMVERIAPIETYEPVPEGEIWDAVM